MNRRTLLYCFGLAAVAPVLSARPDSRAKVAVSQPDNTRFAFSTSQQASLTPCKATSEDTAGSCSIFEMLALPRSGPFLHVHHREDEWYYVLQGEFLFRAGEAQYTLPAGASIWLPRGIPHVWANTTNAQGKLILMCQPGGFERFFDEMGSVAADKKSQAMMGQLMAKYGMEMLGPPIFASSWMLH